jgi:hypothetical protein
MYQKNFAMKMLSTALLLLLSFSAFAQFAVIQDKDGYSNVRDSAHIEARLTDTLHNGHFVYCFEKKGNWVNIDYTKKQADRRGYVYFDRLRVVTEFESIPPVSGAANSITFSKDSLTIMLTRHLFKKSNNKFTYYKEAEGQIELINGKPIWGTDGGMPGTQYKSIVVSIGQRKIHLPATAINNLFEPRLTDTQVNYDSTNDILYIQSSNSDGAGFYQVIWKIEKGIYKERYIASGI